MLSYDDLKILLLDLGADRVERTISVTNTDILRGDLCLLK